MFKKLLNGIIAQRSQNRLAELQRGLLRREAKIGGTLFGSVPAGHRREFFCLDKQTWVWHEEWVDGYGENKHRTTRYDVRPGGILKSQNGNYQPVSLEEARHLQSAARAYRHKVMNNLYQAAL